MKKFKLRPLLFKLHLYLSVAVGAWVVILGITGAVLAFETEIDHLTHAKLAYVKPAPPRLSFAKLGDAVAKAYPGQKILAYTLGEAPNLSTVVRVGVPRVSNILVYVNPYTGEILGSRRGDDRGLVGAVSIIHQVLALPPPGRGEPLAIYFISWIAVAALFLLASGIWLWWKRMRFGIRARGGRPFWYDVHATSGIVAALFLFLLTITGIVMGFSDTTQPILYAITGSKPAPPPKMPAPPSDGTPPIPIDRAFAIAADALPGAKPLAIIPQGNVYFVGARRPGDHDPEMRSGVLINAYTGAVITAGGGDNDPAGRRLWNLSRAIHFGVIFGIPSQVIMALASLLVVVQAVSGVVMWIKRVSFREMIPALALTAIVTGIAIYTVFTPAG